ncbi:hypothetical protein GJ688_05230 [Heliobacillus mobilis]|uniref:Uncharacterized protein n=1 Tax=Heliobacterium mobile TaxID=28064 RepID=A0A6I3SHN7_HELMO|nr:hypothetical protein [Heliobacterium mobile]MTV48384.1 hypothetical protein [Heliobacterium mobile]
MIIYQKMSGMKKSLSVAALLVALTVVAGCNSNGASTSNPTAQSQSGKEGTTNGAAITLPDRQPELVGKVKDIVGNEVTLYKGKIEQNQDGASSNNNGSDGTANGNGQNQNNQNRRNRQNNLNGQNDQTGQNSQNGQNGENRNQRDNGQRPAGMGRMTFTDETETILIPVGTPLATMQRGSRDAVSAQLTDIKKDQIIRIWKKGDTIEFVQLLGGVSGSQRPDRQQGSGQAGSGSQRPGGPGGPTGNNPQ